jgi:hypothetical protein
MINLRFVILLTILSTILISGIVSAGYVETDGILNATFTFTGTFVDSSTGEILPSVSVSDNLGFTTTAPAGTFTNTYEYGIVSITSTKSGYASKVTQVLMDADITQNITMTVATGGSQVSYFTPHKVRFMCLDYMGSPIKDMAVSVYGVQTTLGSIDWVANLFGINLDSTPILSTIMSGTTGNDGSIVFIMLETEKYQVQFSKPSQGINETRYYYPKAEEYNEIFWTEQAPVSNTVIDKAVYYSLPNATFISLGFSYNDSMATTSSVMIFVDNESGYNLYTQTYNNQQTLNVTYDLPINYGGSYIWGLSGISSSYKLPLNDTKLYSMDDRQWLINPMDAPNGDALATTVYNYCAVGIIVIFGLIFGRASIKFGAVIVPMIAALMSYIGWLTTPWLIVSFALALGVLIYFRYAEEESGL